jgi:predicted phage terminase large subunit-like protein
MIRSTLGEYNFAGQYQQAPAPFGGGLVKDAWFRYYETSELPTRFEQIVQSWDTANKATELSDYSVCTTWDVKDKHFYLLNVLRKRLDYPSLKRAVWEQYRAFDANVILIEDRASGTQLIQELVHEGLYAVTRYVPERDKVIRLHAQTGAIENGFVHVPKQAHWLPEYLQELTTFRHQSMTIKSTPHRSFWIGAGVALWVGDGSNIIAACRRASESRTTG